MKITGDMRRKAARHIHEYEYPGNRKCGFVCDCTTHANIAIDVIANSIDIAKRRAKGGKR